MGKKKQKKWETYSTCCWVEQGMERKRETSVKGNSELFKAGGNLWRTCTCTHPCTEGT